MADPIYGIHQSQPFDIYSYMKANAKKLNLVGRFSYLPNLLKKPEVAKACSRRAQQSMQSSGL